MIGSALCLIMIAAPVGLMIESTDDPRIAGAVSDAIERTIEQTLGRTVVRLPNDPRCQDQPQQCVDEARAYFRIDDVLLVRVFTAVTQHLVILETHRLGAREPERSTLRLEVEGHLWQDEIAAVIPDLLSAESAPEQKPIDGPAVARQETGPLGPVLIVAGGISIIIGAVLADRASAARRELLMGPSDREDFDRTNARRRELKIASIGLSTGGALLTAGGIVLLWLRW